VVRGGRVAAVRVESTWVTAYVPYSNYRGVVVDFSGRSWLPLMPWIKRTERMPSTALLRTMGVDVGAKLRRHLAAPRTVDVLHELREEVETYLRENDSGAALFEQASHGRNGMAPFSYLTILRSGFELGDRGFLTAGTSPLA
jgi:hypothetical protein